MAGNIRLKFFVSRSNDWHHPFKIFRWPFKQLASRIQNFLFAIQTAGVIRLKFFQCNSNVHSIRSKFFRGRSNGTQNRNICFPSVR